MIVVLIRISFIRRIETGMVALADDDNGEVGWFEAFSAI